MSQRVKIRALLLEGRTPLSLGKVHEAVEWVYGDARLRERLVECLWDDDPGVVNRAAQAVELVSRERPQLFQAYKAELLGLLPEAEGKKLRWSLAAAIPRLQLSGSEARQTAVLLEGFLEDSSSIVKTCALQGIHDLAMQESALLPMALDLLRIHGRSGTPAMRARSRNLLQRLERHSRE